MFHLWQKKGDFHSVKQSRDVDLRGAVFALEQPPLLPPQFDQPFLISSFDRGKWLKNAYFKMPLDSNSVRLASQPNTKWCNCIFEFRCAMRTDFHVAATTVVRKSATQEN